MACCEKCGNFDESYLEESGFNDEWKNARKEFDENYQPDLYYYWQYPLEENYQMPNGFECLCEICFDILNQEGQIKWKE